MARPGPLPSPHRMGHSKQAEWTDVRDEPYVEGEARDLPVREWNPLTLQWWGHLRVMPHARTWREGDWLFALDLAILKDRFYAGLGSASEISEMRKREDLLGLTSEARQKLRIRYVQVHSAAPIEAPQTAPGEPTVVPLTQQRREERDRRRRELLEG